MLQFKEVLFCKFGVALIVGQRLFLCIYAKQSKGFVYIVAFVMAKGVFVKSKANCCVWLIQLWAKRGGGLWCGNKKNRPNKFCLGGYGNWVQGLDLNQRPSGYEPDELPSCSTLRRINY